MNATGRGFDGDGLRPYLVNPVGDLLMVSPQRDLMACDKLIKQDLLLDAQLMRIMPKHVSFIKKA